MVVALVRLVVIVPVRLAVMMLMVVALVLAVVVAVVLVVVAAVLAVVVTVMLVAGIGGVRGCAPLGMLRGLKMSGSRSHRGVPLGVSNPGKDDRGERERQQRYRCGNRQETAKSQRGFAPSHTFTPSSPLLSVPEYTCSYRAARV
ncbi:MAG: hypothetical protein QOD46_1173 [Actinomycetota bacterium]|nr:hypothetical protein [Actinomycetota bacterium]